MMCLVEHNAFHYKLASAIEPWRAAGRADVTWPITDTVVEHFKFDFQLLAYFTKIVIA